MNYKMVSYLLGQIFKLEAALLLLPFAVSLIYGENLILAFAIPFLILVSVSIPLTIKKPTDKRFYAKEGFVVVAFSWILLSLIGALPFYISGEVPSFIDCFFETASGFSTTGATVINDVEALSKGLLFWRSFTHWIGGMGVLVFVLAIFPQQETQSIFLMKAESPGPQVGKIVSKLAITARILYGIYIVMTIIEFIMLVCGGMPVFDSILNSFATAGTGGFAIKNGGIADYRLIEGCNYVYCEYVISAFMILFGVNFNIFYLILIGKAKTALKNEEFLVYLGVIIASVAAIAVNTINVYSTFEETFRTSLFQVASIISTTGFSTTDYDLLWPQFSKTIIILLMFFGASAGSTGGGIKIARIIIMLKTAVAEIRRTVSPHAVISVKYEGKPVEKKILQSTSAYLIAYVLILILSVIAVSIFDNFDFESTFTAVLSCLNNIGPGMKAFGPTCSFASLSAISKIILSFDMITGRLELFPVLILFSRKTYRN